MRQYGSDPYLPEPQNYLLPPMSVPKEMGWKPGETPTVTGGLKIQAMATGLMHPRIVYPLPNGDILVVEGNSPGTTPFRPKDFIQGKVKARGRNGRQGRQPHHPASRFRRRRKAGDSDGPRRPPSLTVWRGLCGRHPLRRQHGRDHGVQVRARANPDHRARYEACGPSSRTDRPPLDQIDGRQP